jgi:hypothetical protein
LSFRFSDDLFFLVQYNCLEVLIAIAFIVDYAAVVVNAAGVDIFAFSRITKVSSCVALDASIDLLIALD